MISLSHLPKVSPIITPSLDGPIITPIPPGEPLKPLPPTETLSPIAPSGPVITAAPCCWCKVFDKDISVHGSKYVLSTQHPNHQVKYHLNVDLIAGIVTISRVLDWGAVDAAVTEAEKTAIRAGLIGVVPRLLSNKYTLVVTDPSCNPATKTMQIVFRLRWASATAGAANLKINLAPGPRRSTASGTHMNLDTQDTANGNFTLAHEFLHTIGQVDEYRYTAGATVSAAYHRANGSSTTIALPPPSGNMMATATNLTLQPRFFWFVEIEVQELLRSAGGLGKTGITCKVQ